MAPDIQRHLERARRNLERNRLRDAVAEYQAVIGEVPSHQESLQALADLHTRLGEPAAAAQYHGIQFDRLLDAGDVAKASAIFSRFLRPYPQPSDRLMRYAALLQKQNRTGEAIEQFSAAAELFLQQNRNIEALACYESIAVLDPENPARHLALGELAESSRHADLAARSFVRAGQLIRAAGDPDEALTCFSRAHQLLPNDRTAALLLAEATLRKGDAPGTVALLEPFAPSEKDAAFLALFGEGLLRAGRLDQARAVFETYYTQKPDTFAKLFEIAGAYVRAGADPKATALLMQVKDWMRAARREQELFAQLDRLAAEHPKSLSVAEIVARIYEGLNREAKYFDALVRLFDLYLVADRTKEACEALNRLVDIDPYDYRNHERIAKLEGKVDPGFLQSILSRAAKAATVSTRTDGFAGAGSEAAAANGAPSEEVRAQQALEDLIVQVEIFLQYSLQTKAVERLERIAETFPGEEEKNERLRALYDRANWWPKGSPRPAPKPAPAAPPPPPPPPLVAEPPAAPSAADTHRDLAAIAEINRLMHRQATPREILAAAAAEIGKHLHVTRCIAAAGTTNDVGQMTAEFAAPGAAATTPAQVSSLLATLSQASPDSLGGVELQAANAPPLGALGLESALGVVFTDKENPAFSGAILVGDASPRKWKPNESFFLQAVGDQLVLSVNHTRLRSLVRSMAVADEKTGLLNRSSYIDCLLTETNRARIQGTPLSLVMLQVDRGSDLLRQHGDALVDQYVEQLARTLSSAVRQTDVAVKYTAWSLAFILPGTSLDNARGIAEKLRQLAAAVHPPWGGQSLTASAIVAEASTRPGDETEDRVTEWINRAEAGLDQARQNGGNALVPLATP